jgi:hypothetical protein
MIINSQIMTRLLENENTVKSGCLKCDVHNALQHKLLPNNIKNSVPVHSKHTASPLQRLSGQYCLRK